MEDVRPEAVEALQSIIGRQAPLTMEADRETIVISNQATGASWTFRPVEVGRLEKNHVAHDINKLEHWTPDGKNQDQKEDQPLFISEHVTAGAGEFLRAERISYLDAGGNCFLQNDSLLIFVRGQDSKDRPRTHRSIRAFNSAGLKLIFALLVRPEVAHWTYRELADMVEIGRGTVGYVMKDLQELGFVEKRRKSRTLRKTADLMDRWTTGYTERLRSELSRGRFTFLPSRKATGWQSHLSNLWASKWGGEPGADLLTGNFRPEVLTLYTREATSTICQELEAAPDPEGSIEILDMFWDPAELEGSGDATGRTVEHVPPLLIYADLVASADPRARRAAKKIWDRYLVADET